MIRKIFVVLALILGGLVAAAAPAAADVQTTSCTNTTYVNSSTPTTNYGSAQDLNIAGTTKYAYLECVVAGLPTGAVVSSSTLGVFSRSPNTAHTLRSHTVASGWTESTLTWNNRPAFDPAVLASAPGDLSPGSGEWVNLSAPNVTGNGTYRYALDVSSTGTQAYASDDYTFDVTRRPKLTVTYNTGPPPTGGWATVVDDQFTTAGLPTHWSAYNGPYGSGAHNCAAPSQVQVPGDGYLHMKMEYLSSGNCGAAWYTAGLAINGTSGFRSGPDGDQAIEVRWRIVPSAFPTIVRSHRIIPMHWPEDDSGSTGYAGEADYCEGGSSLNSCTPFYHYGNGSSQVTRPDIVTDLTQWHTMRFERRDLTVTIFVDGVTYDTYVGTSTTLPAKVLGAVLQQECPGAGCPSSSYAGNVEDIQIDYIKIENPA